MPFRYGFDLHEIFEVRSFHKFSKMQKAETDLLLHQLKPDDLRVLKYMVTKVKTISYAYRNEARLKHLRASGILIKSNGLFGWVSSYRIAYPIWCHMVDSQQKYLLSKEEMATLDMAWLNRSMNHTAGSHKSDMEDIFKEMASLDEMRKHSNKR